MYTASELAARRIDVIAPRLASNSYDTLLHQYLPETVDHFPG